MCNHGLKTKSQGGWGNVEQSMHLLFNRVFDQLSCLVFHKDAQNRHLRVNQTVAALRGMDSGLMDSTAVDDWHPDEAMDYYRADLDVVESKRSKLAISELIEIAPGCKGRYQTDKHPWLDVTGTVVGLLVVSQPIGATTGALRPGRASLTVVKGNEKPGERSAGSSSNDDVNSRGKRQKIHATFQA